MIARLALRLRVLPDSIRTLDPLDAASLAILVTLERRNEVHDAGG